MHLHSFAFYSACHEICDNEVQTVSASKGLCDSSHRNLQDTSTYLSIVEYSLDDTSTGSDIGMPLSTVFYSDYGFLPPLDKINVFEMPATKEKHKDLENSCTYLEPTDSTYSELTQNFHAPNTEFNSMSNSGTNFSSMLTAYESSSVEPCVSTNSLPYLTPRSLICANSNSLSNQIVEKLPVQSVTVIIFLIVKKPSINIIHILKCLLINIYFSTKS